MGKQDDGLGLDGLFSSDRIAGLIGPRLEPDRVGAKVEQLHQPPPHSRFVLGQAWGLGDDIHVKIDQSPCLKRRQCEYQVDELSRIPAPVEGVGVRKMLAQVPGPDCAEQSIAQGMKYRITIAVRDQSVGTRDAAIGQDDAIPRFEPVDVIADPDPLAHAVICF